MASFFRVCCGEGEEETKYSGIVDADEMGWDNPHGAEERRGQVQRIRSVEKQISLMNKVRPEGRAAIFARPFSINSVTSFHPPCYEKTDEEKGFLSSVVGQNFLFMDLKKGEHQQFIDAMQKETVSAGTTIIEQGGIGDFFYIVESGKVLFMDKSEVVGETHRGGSFGELALLYDSPRAVSCVSETPTVLWKVDQSTFRHLVASHAHSHARELKSLLQRIEIFKGLDDSTLSSFTDALTPVTWANGSRIVQKGEEGNVFYIVESGTVKVHDIGLGDSQFEDQLLGPGEWFGERSLLTGEPRAANITALNTVVTLAIDRETFERTVGPFKELVDLEMKRHFLKSIPIFAESEVLDPEIEQMAKLVEEICYRKGAAIVNVGDLVVPALHVIRHGRVLVYNQAKETINNLESGDYFGDKAILSDSDYKNKTSVICEDDVTAWILTKDSIESVIGEVTRLGNTKGFLKQEEEKCSSLADLNKIRILGMGAFGEVWLVSDKIRTGSTYALKAVNKRKLLESKQEGGVVREKEFLHLLSHPFILHLVSSFQDEMHLYLLLPVIPGGELFSVLHKQKRKDSGLIVSQACFYAACIVEAFGHFHQRSICYRDLKLENVLLDEQGYCKIVDLGFAKIVNGKTYTLVGTPEYIAPEIILSKGHDQAVDFWAFGVLVYELLVGYSPFFLPNSSQMDMFKRIVTVKYTVPSFLDEPEKILISGLLTRKPSERLGNRSMGYLEVKSSSWFQDNNIDFRALTKKQAEAPWIPTVSNPLDASNFDTFEEPSRGSWRRLTKEEQEKFKGF